jgi:hypothetical protein
LSKVNIKYFVLSSAERVFFKKHKKFFAFEAVDIYSQREKERRTDIAL